MLGSNDALKLPLSPTATLPALMPNLTAVAILPPPMRTLRLFSMPTSGYNLLRRQTSLTLVRPPSVPHDYPPSTAMPAEISNSEQPRYADEGEADNGLQADSLRSRSFLALLTTQFLGATNDNILRWLVIGIGKKYVDDDLIDMQVSTVLALGSACFVLPYILLAAPAGYLADRFSKREVIIACKLAEMAIMVLTLVAILIGNAYLLFFTVAIMGGQSALMGPAKLGSIPEMLRPEKISSANGVIGLTTVVATVAGSAIGNQLSGMSWSLAALVLISVALVGWIASLFIARLTAANPHRDFPWDMAGQTWRDLRILASDRAMLRVALGIMFFWTLGMLANLNIDQFAEEGGTTDQSQVTPLLAALIVGVGAGSVLAGIWSGGKVELGILPLGAGGLAVFSFLLFTIEGQLVGAGPGFTVSYFAACVLLFLLGVSSGLFDVPLAAFMQHQSRPEHRGSILAASNFLTFAGMLLASFGYWLLRVPTGRRDMPLFEAREIFLLCGLATIPVFIYIVVLIPQATIKFMGWLGAHTIYRTYLHGRENLPERDSALLVANHVTWIDGLFLVCTSERPMRLMISGEVLNSPWKRGLARVMGAIPVGTQPKLARRAIRQARKALNRGELVCIFPEGRITRSGQLQSFSRGLMPILRGTNAPVIPVYLDELWGSIFSYRGGKLLWRWSNQWPHRVSIWFGKPMPEPQNAHEVRHAVQELGVQAALDRKTRTLPVSRAMIRSCRRAKWRWKIADSTGAKLTGGQLLMRSLILRRLLLREILTPDEQYVGMLIPPTTAGVVANAAVTLAGRVAVNLNFTASSEIVNKCIRKAGIRHVLTSRKVLERFPLELDAEVIYLEDLRDKVKRGDKLAGALQAYLFPAAALDAAFGLRKVQADDVLTVIFTSGSTGDPKGVMLTYHNVATNVQAIEQVVQLNESDVILGTLPFFHSFGYTVTLWAPLSLDIHAAYHISPLDARVVGKVARDYNTNILLTTATFLRSYIKRCSKEDFASLEVVIAGAEKLPRAVADAFEAKFGVRPVEGYGTSELSPIVSVNIPPSRAHSGELGSREGSVGRPIPGVAARIVDLESGKDLPINESGMLWISGPNVMKGYLAQPDKTAEVIRDGWYSTGDVAKLDADGFIHITGRESRFSKIGGEMVPHMMVEEEINSFLGSDEDSASIAVTAVPDERKGERLVVIHQKLPKPPEEICRALSEAGLPNLWIPSPDSFLEVEEVPHLSTGKLDLRAVNRLARDRFT